MNIKRINGKKVHAQKNGHRTLCNQSLTIRLYNRQNGLFETKSYYNEVNEEVTCEKCIELLKSI